MIALRATAKSHAGSFSSDGSVSSCVWTFSITSCAMSSAACGSFTRLAMKPRTRPPRSVQISSSVSMSFVSAHRRYRDLGDLVGREQTRDHAGREHETGARPETADKAELLIE